LERSSFRVRWKPDSGGSIICAIIPQEALTASIAPNGRPPERITSGGGEGMAIEKSIVFASFSEACNEFYVIHVSVTSYNSSTLTSSFPCVVQKICLVFFLSDVKFELPG
jgi:hypothetical protein